MSPLQSQAPCQSRSRVRLPLPIAASLLSSQLMLVAPFVTSLVTVIQVQRELDSGKPIDSGEE
ncbi:hypothetical protein AVW14_11635 [Stenotrophomonas maltophilia]|nr:hypothetical protein AVW14_11635 [Stenotrophomonas maltophilia]